MTIESSVVLDEISRNLLSALQEDARLSYAELGRRVGLSPAATAERLKRLEEAGIITGPFNAEPSELVCQELFSESLLKPATVFHSTLVTDARSCPRRCLRRRSDVRYNCSS